MIDEKRLVRHVEQNVRVLVLTHYLDINFQSLTSGIVSEKRYLINSGKYRMRPKRYFLKTVPERIPKCRPPGHGDGGQTNLHLQRKVYRRTQGEIGRQTEKKTTAAEMKTERHENEEQRERRTREREGRNKGRRERMQSKNGKRSGRMRSRRRILNVILLAMF